MNDENTARLYREFPSLYRGRNKTVYESQMCWGFQCGDGWFDIVYDLSRQIADYAAQHPHLAQIEMLQVKQKLGTLRCFVKGSDPCIREMIRAASAKSATTCEAPGAARPDTSDRWPG